MLIRKVGLLLARSSLISVLSFTGPDNEGGWSCVIAREIRRFRGVKTIEEYLEKRNIARKVTSQPIIPVMN